MGRRVPRWTPRSRLACQSRAVNRSRWVALCAVLAVIASACGGGSSRDAAATAASTSLKAELLDQSASGASPFRFTNAQAGCTASRVVSAVGTARLQTYGLLNAEDKATTKTLDDTTLSTNDATSVVNAIIDCLGSDNFTAALQNAIGKNIKGTKTTAQRRCLEDKLTPSRLRPMLIATLSGNRASAQGFAQSLLSCMTAK